MISIVGLLCCLWALRRHKLAYNGVKCDDYPIRLGDVEKLGAMTLGVWCECSLDDIKIRSVDLNVSWAFSLGALEMTGLEPLE